MPKCYLSLYCLFGLIKQRRFKVLLCSIVIATIIFMCLSINTAVYFYPQVPFDKIQDVLVVQKNSSTHCEHRLEFVRKSKMLDIKLEVTKEGLENLGRNLESGGFWKPSCSSKYRVNIIIPYRNRKQQLDVFLYNMHPLLQRQELEYFITVVEQSEGSPFNRGKLFNVGFAEMQKRNPADCYIFHDVDLIPLSANNIYACTKQPRHMSSSVDEFRFNLPYEELFGGAVALTSEQFAKANGYSNVFYGWGGEDDDFFKRVTWAGYKVLRFEPSVSMYKMLSHTKEKPNPDRFQKLREGYLRFETDGLTNLEYRVVQFKLRPLYTWILVYV